MKPFKKNEFKEFLIYNRSFFERRLVSSDRSQFHALINKVYGGPFMRLIDRKQALKALRST